MQVKPNKEPRKGGGNGKLSLVWDKNGCRKHVVTVIGIASTYVESAESINCENIPTIYPTNCHRLDLACIGCMSSPVPILT